MPLTAWGHAKRDGTVTDRFAPRTHLIDPPLLLKIPGYWEPAKFVAKVRQMRTNANLLLLKCDMGECTEAPPGRVLLFFPGGRPVALLGP